ncbi:MAG: hypothetical protein WA650_15375, partial [Bradyrhizobium sp.]
MDDPAAAPFLFIHLRSTPVTKTSETQIQTEATEKQVDSATPSRKSSRKSIVALSMLALAINGTAAIYTLPSLDLALPNFSGYQLLPQRA